MGGAIAMYCGFELICYKNCTIAANNSRGEHNNNIVNRSPSPPMKSALFLNGRS